MALFGDPGDVAASFSDALNAALAVPARKQRVEVEGTEIQYRVWNGPDDGPAVLLVHGKLAHSHWWDAVAGWLSRDRQVIALDLSGMGDSGWRPSYSRAQHAREIAAVADNAGLADVLLVAHSYGGDPALRMCRERPDICNELLLLDSRLMLPGVESAATAAGMGPLVRKVYETREEARDRFRLMPASPFADPSLMEHVISHSIIASDGGWSWKYDAGLQTDANPKDPLLVEGIKVPVTYVRGADSVVTPPVYMQVIRSYLPFAEIIEIPACGHHIMLDQPAALTTLLRVRLL